MSIANTLLTGGLTDVAATRSAAEPRPLALQQEDAGASDFGALLDAAARPAAQRETRERHDATVDRGRRAERARAGARASERAVERASERARFARSEASDASASGRADELRYGMLSERRAESADRAADAAREAGEARETAASETSDAAEPATGAGAPPQVNDTAAVAQAADQASAAPTIQTPEQLAEAARAEQAAAAALAAAAADPTRVVRDPNTLAPEFRARLERVVDRMEREFGHEVRIVEAGRTSQRQDFLYEQGRTREGAVVTWTRDSKHLDGRAADLMIDGSYADAAAFQRLHAIAAEEGLRTLGARDPGHVELTGAVSGTPARSANGAAALAALQSMATIEEVRVAGAGDVARVAQVAAVAEVASVASVAPVASPMAAATVAAAGIAAGRSAERGQSEERSDRRERTAEATERRQGERHEERTDALAGLRQAAERAPMIAGGIEATAPVTATDAASRISRVLELQDAAATPRPMSHMMLRLDNAAGGEDRIRVDLRGLGVGTNIDVTDAATADRLGARVGELQRALEQHGLESETVRIGVRGPEAPDHARAAAAAAAHVTERDMLRSADAGASSSQQQNSQDSQRQGAQDERRRTARDQDEPGQQAGDSRHRSRREPHGDRKR